MIIAVCGNIASGKTTISKNIEKFYNFTYIPYLRNELSFLEDFFDDIAENFLQTQIAFLVSKGSQIMELSNYDRNIVIDRSLLEDIKVFAQHWIDNYKIDSRIIRLYNDFVELILKTLPEPEIYILCRSSIENSKEGIKKREVRSFENKYPEDYFEKLQSYYDELIFPKNATTIVINSDLIDFSDKEIISEVLKEIFGCISSINLNIDSKNEQMSFLDDYISQANQKVEYKYISNINYANKKIRAVSKIDLNYVYLAAPFTSLATIRDENEIKLIKPKQEYGVLPLKYQKILLNIKKGIKKHWNFNTIIPHQDVNQWGEKELASDEVLKSIVENINNCEILVAIPGSSIGVHLEIGFALAQKKKILIFDVQEMDASFYVKGFSNLENVLVITVKSIEQITRKLKLPQVMKFISD